MRLVGIWDLTQVSLSLGGLLVFVCELLAKAREKDAQAVDLCFLGGRDSVGISEGLRRTAVPAFLYELDGLDRILAFRDRQDMMTQLDPDALFWPPCPREHVYASTLGLQAHFRIYRSIPRLSFKPDAQKRAWQLLNTHTIPIVVHAKSVTGQGSGFSNACWEAWDAFFGKWRQRGVTFFLLGPDALRGPVSYLPNVVRTQERGLDLGTELAMIQLAYLFMGMSSGPCNMAILGEVPYVIFKHPEHDVEAMEMELDAGGGFPFSLCGQRFIRAHETADILDQACEASIATQSLTSWRRRWQHLTETCHRAE